MDVKEYQALTAAQSGFWYCPDSCIKTVLHTLTTEKEIKERCSKYLNDMSKRLDKLEENMANTCNVSKGQRTHSWRY